MVKDKTTSSLQPNVDYEVNSGHRVGGGGGAVRRAAQEKPKPGKPRANGLWAKSPKRSQFKFPLRTTFQVIEKEILLTLEQHRGSGH